jgi:hypothetical protein
MVPVTEVACGWRTCFVSPNNLIKRKETEIKISSILKKIGGQPSAGPAQRFERKFFIVSRNLGFAYTILRQICRPDKEFPKDMVNSLYFDTVDLDQYEKSASGEYRKNKVRIRWYGEINDSQETVPVYVELKTRQGFASSKQREKFLVPAKSLELANLGSGIVSRTTLIETIARFGFYPEQPLRPIIRISYWRYRFNEMSTGVRVSFDYRIRSSIVASDLGYGERELQLTGGVVEVKGPNLELPVTLRRIRLLDADWSRFSKYSYCIDSHLSDPGSLARFWPSGRMNEP